MIIPRTALFRVCPFSLRHLILYANRDCKLVNYKAGSNNLLSHALLPEQSLSKATYHLFLYYRGIWGLEIKRGGKNREKGRSRVKTTWKCVWLEGTHRAPSKTKNSFLKLNDTQELQVLAKQTNKYTSRLFFSSMPLSFLIK